MRVSQLLNIDKQSGSSAHDHSTTPMPRRAAAAPGSATPELDSTRMNGLTDDKKRSVVLTAQSREIFFAQQVHSKMIIDYNLFTIIREIVKKIKTIHHRHHQNTYASAIEYKRQ